MDLLLHRPGSRLINVEHPEVSTFESDFQTCFNMHIWLVSYSSCERKDCVTSPKRNVEGWTGKIKLHNHKWISQESGFS